jgi:hypothetical protein
MSADPDAAQMQTALTANKIASAAVGISIAAILVAYLQLLLGSDMTSNALWKTNRAAIGVVARQRIWIPSLRRVKVLYPRISLKLDCILEAAFHSRTTEKSPWFLEHLLSSRHLEWNSSLEPDDATINHIRKVNSM